MYSTTENIGNAEEFRQYIKATVRRDQHFLKGLGFRRFMHLHLPSENSSREEFFLYSNEAKGTYAIQRTSGAERFPGLWPFYRLYMCTAGILGPEKNVFGSPDFRVLEVPGLPTVRSAALSAEKRFDTSNIKDVLVAEYLPYGPAIELDSISAARGVWRKIARKIAEEVGEVQFPEPI